MSTWHPSKALRSTQQLYGSTSARPSEAAAKQLKVETYICLQVARLLNTADHLGILTPLATIGAMATLRPITCRNFSQPYVRVDSTTTTTTTTTSTTTTTTLLLLVLMLQLIMLVMLVKLVS